MMSQNPHNSFRPLRCLNHDDYTVAIVCPMKIEQAPMLALLDEEYEMLPTSRDHNAYWLGRIGQHNVVVAAQPDTGNNAAASVITQLLNDFGSIRFGLLVGIGGGIPDEEYDYDYENLHDIRLGDVVVSEPQGQYGGIIQFDRGKSTIKSFLRTGNHGSIPKFLASQIERLKAKHETDDNSILQYVEEMFQRKPLMRPKYEYPGSNLDILFESDYPHREVGKPCTNCDKSRVIKRKDRGGLRPQIHYGTIGSSNMVIEDGRLRDELRNEFKFLCVEMEAAGLMEAFPGLIIRGISDYADSHKNQRWQRHAAATAAAYTKELLLNIPPIDVKNSRAMVEAMGELSAKVDQSIAASQQIQEHQLTEREERILNWLSPNGLHFSSLQETSETTRTPGTGQWLLDGERYRTWRIAKSSLMWLRGVAGCGKTVLCSTVIADLQRICKINPTKRIAYWYFQFSDIQSLSIANMLRSLLRQLSFSPLPANIINLHERHYRVSSQPSLGELTTALHDTLRFTTGDVYIVLDALDEYPAPSDRGDRKQLLDCIVYLAKAAFSKLHLFVTSRPEPDIWDVLLTIANPIIDIEQLVKADVANHVKTLLAGPDFNFWSQEVKNQIMNRLLVFEERRFRWADLQLRSLKDCPTQEQLEQRLKQIPKDLQTTYREAFDTIDSENRVYVEKIMMWLTTSFEPLDVKGVAAVVNFPNPDSIFKICKSIFVTIVDRQSDKVIRLAHLSVKEFLLLEIENRRISWVQFSSQLAHKTIAFTALEILLSWEDRRDPLFRYSAQFWPTHTKIADNTKEGPVLESKIDLLFDSEHTENFEAWLDVSDPDKPAGSRFSIAAYRGHPLYYASLLGLESVMEKLWINQRQLSMGEGFFNNAIEAAAVKGNMNCFKWLTQRCQEPAELVNICRLLKLIEENIEENLLTILETLGVLEISSKMVVAAAANMVCGDKILRVLLDHWGEKVPITNKVVKKAVGNYTRGEEAMRLLLDRRDHAIFITDQVVRNAARSSSGLMKLLLKIRPQEVRITDEVVVAAAGSLDGHRLMQLLLDRRPDEVHITDAVLVAAAGSPYGRRLMQLLLDRRPDEVHITDAVLVAAARSREGHILQILLDRRPDEVHITDAVLVAAARNPDAHRLMQLLLDRRPDEVHITDAVVVAAAGHWDGHRLLQLLRDQPGGEICIMEDVVLAAAQNINTEKVLQFMLDHWPEEVHITQKVVMATAESVNGSRLLQLLLDRRPEDVYITGEVLEAAAGAGYPSGKEVMELLSDRRLYEIIVTDRVAEVAVGNKIHGESIMELLFGCLRKRRQRHGLMSVLKELQLVLWWTARAGFEGTVRHVVDIPGINIDEKSEDGTTALQQAILKNRDKVEDLLLERGAQVPEDPLGLQKLFQLKG